MLAVAALLTASAMGVLLAATGETVMPAGAARNTGATLENTTWEALTPEGKVALLRLAVVSWTLLEVIVIGVAERPVAVVVRAVKVYLPVAVSKWV